MSNGDLGCGPLRLVEEFFYNGVLCKIKYWCGHFEMVLQTEINETFYPKFLQRPPSLSACSADQDNCLMPTCGRRWGRWRTRCKRCSASRALSCTWSPRPPWPCPPKVMGSNCGYSDPVDRGVRFLQLWYRNNTAFPLYFTQCVPRINPSF